MFSIVLEEKKNLIIESVYYSKFRIILGDYSETFLAPLSYWSVADYVHQWKKMLTPFFDGKVNIACLVTEMYDPTVANFIRMWVLYRENDSVHIQEQLLFMEDLDIELSIDDIVRHVPVRETEDEDGCEISEWTLPFSKLADVKLIGEYRHS